MSGTICAGASAAASASSNESAEFLDEAFGTDIYATLSGQDANLLQTAFDEVMVEFKAIEEFISANIPTSDISKFNSLKADSKNNFIENVHPFTVELLKEAKRLYNRTSGAFNPCAYLLTDLWQLSARYDSGQLIYAYDRSTVSLPEQKYIDAFKNLMDFDTIIIEEFSTPQNSNGIPVYNRITKTAEPVKIDGVSYDMKIDLGAIAKGYACDRAKSILNGRGIADGYVSAGGSSVLLLNNPDSSDGKWTVSLADPEKPYSLANPYVKIDASGVLSTSGDYQPGKYNIIDGVRYCHIIDTQTGAPIRTNIRTASVYGPNLSAGEADALSTAVMAMGFEKAKAFINNPDVVSRGIKIIFVYERTWALGSVFEVICNFSKTELDLQSADYKLCGFVGAGGILTYNPLMPDLWFALTLTAVLIAASAGLTVYFARRTNRADTGKGSAVQTLKKQKFFLKRDIFVYAFVTVLIAVLLIIFVFAPAKTDLNALLVYHRNVLIYSYNFETQSGEICAASFADKVTVEKDGAKTLIKIIDEDGGYNLISIQGKSAQMENANCSNRKDCVTAFRPITNGGQVIVCNPHNIKLVGADAQDAGLPNGLTATA